MNYCSSTTRWRQRAFYVAQWGRAQWVHVIIALIKTKQKWGQQMFSCSKNIFGRAFMNRMKSQDNINWSHWVTNGYLGRYFMEFILKKGNKIGIAQIKWQYKTKKASNSFTITTIICIEQANQDVLDACEGITKVFFFFFMQE